MNLLHNIITEICCIICIRFTDNISIWETNKGKRESRKGDRKNEKRVSN